MTASLIPIENLAGVPCAKPEHEAFALALVEHGNASAAYRHAYPQTSETPGSVRNSASRLAQHSDVRRRMVELEQQRRARILRESEDLEAMVANLCSGKPAKLLDEEGNPIPLHLLPVEVQNAIKGLKLKITRDAAGNTESEYEVTFPDPLQAMRLLAQLRGALVERQDITSGGRTLQVVAAEDLPQLDAELSRRLLPALEGEADEVSDVPGSDLV